MEYNLNRTFSIAEKKEFINLIDHLLVENEGKMDEETYEMLTKVVQKFGTYCEFDGEFAIAVIDIKKKKEEEAS